MKKELNQQEIDAMVRAAHGGAPVEGVGSTQFAAERWDVRQAGRIGREQLQTITTLHESFARNLTHSLGAYLRVVFTTTLVSAEHLTYREFLQGIPETTYIASCRLDPTGHNAALQLDLKVAFPIIDLLLGGEGKAVAATDSRQRSPYYLPGTGFGVAGPAAGSEFRGTATGWRSTAADGR